MRFGKIIKQYNYNKEVSYTLNSSKLEEYQIIAEEINERKDMVLFASNMSFLFMGNTVIMSCIYISFKQTIATIFIPYCHILMKTKKLFML
jgi:hypothetical protein